jgi:predicted ATPase/transcriptional regulator with XRE-family HTH domain
MAATSSATFGALLRRHRLSAGLTQEELAEQAGLSARALQRLERGHGAPRAETLRLLAAALHLSSEARTDLTAAVHPELTASPAPAHRSPRPARPPIAPTPLVGREREVAAACALLRHADGTAGTRLLTLTGPGGVGKTRLALAVYDEIRTDFADGGAWVDLGALRDVTLVPAAMVHALGIEERGDRAPRELLTAMLAERHLLLVLDNCEHLLPAMPFVAELLAAGPHLVVLATSRSRLRLRGERESPVRPLAVPGAEGASSPLAGLAGVAAVRLFVERAQAVKPDFFLTAEQAPAVAEICRRLDGLPLALELAAARVKVLPPASLLAQLERRLPLLTAGAREAPARQRTMHDTIAWSYELLNPEEQTLFRRLAVFAGGFSLEAAEAVWGEGDGVMGSWGDGTRDRLPDAYVARTPHHPITPSPPFPLDLVASLLDHSLLQRAAGPDDEPRFRLLETIREYGLEQLAASGEADEARDAHAAYYLALGEAAELGMQGPEQAQWLHRLESEHDNLRAALHWLPVRGAASAALRLAGALWFFRWIRGYYAESRATYEALLALPGAAVPTRERAKALNGLGVTALSQGEPDRAVATHEEALSIGRALGDDRDIAFSLVCLAAALTHRAEVNRALAAATESLALCRERSDRWGAQMAIGLLAFVAMHQGDREQAEALFRESLAMEQALGVQWPTALTLDSLGWLALDRGDVEQARALFGNALQMMDEVGDRRDRPDALVGLGRAVECQGDLVRAIALYEESLAGARETGDQRATAQALYWLGHAVWRRGDGSTAAGLVRQALAAYDAMGDQVYVAASLEALAILAASEGETERAVRLSGAVSALLKRLGATIPGPDRFDPDAAIELTEGPGASTTAWACHPVLIPEQAVAEALHGVDVAV